MTRPPQPDTPPAGYVYVPAEEPEDGGSYAKPFVVLEPGETPRRCRWLLNRRACGKPSVAKMNRGKTSYTGGSVGKTSEAWWHYCADHLYGRWIEDGRLMHWRLVPADLEAGYPVEAVDA